MKKQIEIGAATLMYAPYGSIEQQICKSLDISSIGTRLSNEAYKNTSTELSKAAKEYDVIINTDLALLCGSKFLDGLKFCHIHGFTLMLNGPGAGQIRTHICKLLEVEDHMSPENARWVFENIFSIPG